MHVVKSIFRFEMSAAVKIGKNLDTETSNHIPFQKFSRISPNEFFFLSHSFSPVITTVDFQCHQRFIYQ